MSLPLTSSRASLPWEADGDDPDDPDDEDPGEDPGDPLEEARYGEWLRMVQLQSARTPSVISTPSLLSTLTASSHVNSSWLHQSVPV